jgi:transposase-like protein
MDRHSFSGKREVPKHAPSFTMSKLGKVKPPEVLRMVLKLYLEGVSFRGMERILQVSHVAVIQWVRRWGKAIEGMRKEAV